MKRLFFDIGVVPLGLTMILVFPFIGHPSERNSDFWLSVFLLHANFLVGYIGRKRWNEKSPWFCFPDPICVNAWLITFLAYVGMVESHFPSDRVMTGVLYKNTVLILMLMTEIFCAWVDFRQYQKTQTADT